MPEGPSRLKRLKKGENAKRSGNASLQTGHVAAALGGDASGYETSLCPFARHRGLGPSTRLGR
jgi:hypothetical protein